MKNLTLKNKIKNKELTIGSWITIGHPAISEILCKAGFDWLVIDIEHTTIDLSMVQVLISSIQANNIAAIVRVSKNEEVVIKRVLDAGADGIIVPMINSSEDATRAVEYAKYPPEGKRGVGLSRAQQYGNGFDEYKKWAKENLIIIAQIEHIDGINNLEEIVKTEGIDGTLIGPYDLSGSMGIPGQYNEPIVIDALNQYIKVCEKFNIAMGFHVIEPTNERLKEKIVEGYTFLAFSTDFLFMGKKATDEMQRIVKI
ncbi:MAG: HpcH/HpaI aldolase family protein [Bacteroidales bacterium]